MASVIMNEEKTLFTVFADGQTPVTITKAEADELHVTLESIVNEYDNFVDQLVGITEQDVANGTAIPTFSDRTIPLLGWMLPIREIELVHAHLHTHLTGVNIVAAYEMVDRETQAWLDQTR